LKITREELSHSTEEASLDLFLQGIKAETTKKKYTRTLRKIVCDIFEDILEGDFEQRTDQLVKLSKENPKWATDLLLSLSKKVKEILNNLAVHPIHIAQKRVRNREKS